MLYLLVWRKTDSFGQSHWFVPLVVKYTSGFKNLQRSCFFSVWPRFKKNIKNTILEFANICISKSDTFHIFIVVSCLFFVATDTIGLVSQVKVLADDRAVWGGKVFVSEPLSDPPPMATTSCVIEDRGNIYKYSPQIIYILIEFPMTKEDKTSQCWSNENLNGSQLSKAQQQ